MKNYIILSLLCAPFLTQALPMAIESRSNTPKIIDCSITTDQLKNLTQKNLIQKPKTQEKWSLTKKIVVGTASAAAVAATIYTIKNHQEIYNCIKNYFYKPTTTQETRLALYTPQAQIAPTTKETRLALFTPQPQKHFSTKNIPASFITNTTPSKSITESLVPQKNLPLNAIKNILLDPKLYQLSYATTRKGNYAPTYHAMVNALHPTITTDAEGNTLLHKLVTFDKFPVNVGEFLEALKPSCEQLIKNGASINACNNDGFTPFDLLMQSIVKSGGDASGDVNKYFGSISNYYMFGGNTLLEKIEKEHLGSSNRNWALLATIRTLLGGKEGDWTEKDTIYS